MLVISFAIRTLDFIPAPSLLSGHPSPERLETHYTSLALLNRQVHNMDVSGCVTGR